MGFTTVHNDECGGTWLPEVRVVHLQGKIKVMYIESLYPANDVYQVFDDNNNMAFQGTQSECMVYQLYNELEDSCD